MLIILTLYIVLVWLLFWQLKLVRWGWVSGAVAVMVGAFILAVFLALFNYLTPSGRFTVVSRVTEVMPNAGGRDSSQAERASDIRRTSYFRSIGALPIQG
jgi:hypothetical protein